MTKDLIAKVRKEVFENLEKENIKHNMMIIHLQEEVKLEEDNERKSKILLKIKQIQDGIEANKRFIAHNE